MQSFHRYASRTAERTLPQVLFWVCVRSRLGYLKPLVPHVQVSNRIYISWLEPAFLVALCCVEPTTNPPILRQTGSCACTTATITFSPIFAWVLSSFTCLFTSPTFLTLGARALPLSCAWFCTPWPPALLSSNSWTLFSLVGLQTVVLSMICRRLRPWIKALDRDFPPTEDEISKFNGCVASAFRL